MTNRTHLRRKDLFFQAPDRRAVIFRDQSFCGDLPPVEGGVLYSPDGTTFFELLAFDRKETRISKRAGVERLLRLWSPHHLISLRINWFRNQLHWYDQVEVDGVLFSSEPCPTDVDLVTLPEQLVFRLNRGDEPIFFQSVSGESILHPTKDRTKVLFSHDGSRFFQGICPDYNKDSPDRTFRIDSPHWPPDVVVQPTHRCFKRAFLIDGQLLIRKPCPAGVIVVRAPEVRTPMHLFRGDSGTWLYLSYDKYSTIGRHQQQCQSIKVFEGRRDGLCEVPVDAVDRDGLAVETASWTFRPESSTTETVKWRFETLTRVDAELFNIDENNGRVCLTERAALAIA